MLPDLEISEDRAQAQELILADGTVEPSELYFSEIVYPTESWLVPVSGNTICRKGNPAGFDSWRKSQFYGSGGRDHLEKPGDDPERIEDRIDTGLLEALSFNGYREDQEQRREGGLESPGPEFREAVPEIEEKGAKRLARLFSSKTAVVLIKAMTVLVILLMAVEAVLYLI